MTKNKRRPDGYSGSGATLDPASIVSRLAATTQSGQGGRR
jgi:hypothetical protein